MAAWPVCCQQRTFPFTLREHGVPFFVAAPHIYASSATAGAVVLRFACGSAASVGGRRSSVVFDAGMTGRFSIGGCAAVFTALLFETAFTGRSIVLPATRSFRSGPRLQ